MLIISEAKLDSSFPVGQFLIYGFSKAYRLDRNSNGGGNLLYILEDIPSKLIDTKMTTKSFFVEVNLRGEKRITCCFYNPKTSLISSHLNEIEPKLDLLSSRYENFLSLGYFNAEPTTTIVSDFCEFYSLKNSKDVICLKNPCAPTCIVLMIKNQPRFFKHSMVIETGLSDFHSMCVTFMKTYYNKQKLHIVKYRNSKNFPVMFFSKISKLFCQNLIMKKTFHSAR